MKLEKTWMGICVWVIYLVGMIFAIGVTGFVSGLFPLFNRYYVAGGTAAVCALAAVIIGLLLNFIVQKIVEPSRLDKIEKPLWLELIIPVIIIVSAFFAFGFSSSLASEFTGNTDLYDSAVIAASGQNIELSSFADKAYVAVLKVFMGFLGNSLNTAYTLNLVLRIMLVFFLYISLRVVLGMIPAIIGCIATIAIPSFGYSLKSVNSGQLLSTAIFFLLMISVIYVYGFTKAASAHWYYMPISLLYGAFLGFMIYVDAASAAVIALLIAAWVLFDLYGETINICVNEIIILVSGVLAFGGMLIYEGGIDNIPDTYYHWTWRFYGYNENAWLTMSKGSVYNTILALGLMTFALIPAVLFFKKRCTKASSLIAFSLLGLIASVLLGDTVANSEVMIIAYVVILICCGIAAMIHVKEFVPVTASKSDEGEEGEENEESQEVNDDEETSKVQVIVPEENNETIETTNSEESDTVTEAEEEKVEDKEVKEEKEKEETPRYVPEGMVLPMGEEDEEDLVPNFNMNRPEMADIGVLSVGTPVKEALIEDEEEPIEEPEEEIKEEPKEEPKEETSEKKDDFDLNIAPGDDFDI